MIKFNKSFTWTILTSTLVFIAGEPVNFHITDKAHDVPRLLPTNATEIQNMAHPWVVSFFSYAEICWPNTTELWADFLNSHPKIPKETRQRLHCNVISEQFDYHIMQIITHMLEIRDLLNQNKTQNEIPKAATAAKIASQSIPEILSTQKALCMSNLTLAFWGKHKPKNLTVEKFQRFRSKFNELNQNFTNQMIRVITMSEEISNMIHVDANTREEPETSKTSEKKSTTEVVGEKKDNFVGELNTKGSQERLTNHLKNTNQNESFFKSAIVAVLLMVIAIQLTCIVILYRKLHCERYKDAPILLQDELMNRFYNAENNG